MGTTDQYHLTVRAPAGLREPRRRRISKALNWARFRQQLARAVRAVLATYPQAGPGPRPGLVLTPEAGHLTVLEPRQPFPRLARPSPPQQPSEH